MWATVNEILTKIDDFVWGPPLMVLIMVGGILLTIRMGVLQIRKLPALVLLHFCKMLQ